MKNMILAVSHSISLKLRRNLNRKIAHLDMHDHAWFFSGSFLGSTAQHIFNKFNFIFTTHLFWRWPVLFLSLHRLHRHWFQLGFSVLLQDGCNYPGSIDPHDFDSSSQNITAWNRITTKTLWQWRISRHKTRGRLLYQNESSVPSQNPKWRADV